MTTILALLAGSRKVRRVSKPSSATGDGIKTCTAMNLIRVHIRHGCARGPSKGPGRQASRSDNRAATSLPGNPAQRLPRAGTNRTVGINARRHKRNREGWSATHLAAYFASVLPSARAAGRRPSLTCAHMLCPVKADVFLPSRAARCSRMPKAPDSA